MYYHPADLMLENYAKFYAVKTTKTKLYSFFFKLKDLASLIIAKTNQDYFAWTNAVVLINYKRLSHSSNCST